MKTGESTKYWFPAQRHGWGWGLPSAWQGWIVLLVYVAMIALLAWHVPPRIHPFLFAGLVVLASALLGWVCWAKGEPPSWRWGK